MSIVLVLLGSDGNSTKECVVGDVPECRIVSGSGRGSGPTRLCLAERVSPLKQSQATASGLLNRFPDD